MKLPFVNKQEETPKEEKPSGDDTKEKPKGPEPLTDKEKEICDFVLQDEVNKLKEHIRANKDGKKMTAEEMAEEDKFLNQMIDLEKQLIQQKKDKDSGIKKTSMFQDDM